MKISPTEKRNVLLLASLQALFQTASVSLIVFSGLVGLDLASEKSLATLPVALMMVAAAATMIPASMLMQRLGRKTGFFIGTLTGCLAGLIGAFAVWVESFWLFVFANMLFGSYQAFAQYYRFAAAEAASENFKSRAISWVIAGGVVAAIAGPNITRLTESVGTVPFMASCLALFVLAIVSSLLVLCLSLTTPAEHTYDRSAARPLPEIMRQPVFIAALASSAIGYAVMIMVMTATPLAMKIYGHSLGDSATVIQWHVLGMFLPSFFTGSLIHRFGVLPIIGSGIAILACHVGIALSGNDFYYFLSGLILVGLGWNFLFIGGTNLLTESYLPAERAKTQAAHDFLMFAAVSIASFSAGGLLELWGWRSVNLTVLPFLAVALIAVLWFATVRRKPKRTLANQR